MAFSSVPVSVQISPFYTDSLVAQMVSALVQETCVQFLGWEDPLEEGVATHSSIPCWRIPMDRQADDYNQWGCKESDMVD